MTNESGQPDERKLYEPPKLTTVSLRPEEAVLGHCKTSTGRDQCGNPCMSFLCQNVGS